jgi:hypothetical protein
MFVSPSSSFLPQKGRRARLWAVVLLCLAPVAFGFLALALGQDANWDLRNYHYYNAYAFLNNRTAQDLLPSQTPYFYNPLMDVPFFILATHASARVTGFFLGLVQGLNFILLFWIAHATLTLQKQKYKVFVCAALATLGMLGGGGIAQIGTTFGDNMTSLGALLSAALVIGYWDRLSAGALPKAFILALIFGIPAGFMMGLKLPAVIYAVGLCGGLLFVGKDWRRGFVLSFAFGLGVLVGCFLTYGYWAVFLQTHFGSPLFPYFNDFFQSPLAPLTSARDTQFAPHSLSDYFVMPFLFAESSFRVGEIDLRDWRIPILYVLLPLALGLRLIWRRGKVAEAVASPEAARYLLASFALAYVVWLAMFSIYRYAVTLEMIAPLLIVLAAGMLPFKMKTRGIIAVLLLIIVAVSIKPGNWTRRDVWLDRFVEAQIPDLGDTSNLMILMAGTEPYSHVIPEFPPEISFVRVQSNFSSPEQDKGIDRLLHERVEVHRKKGGRFMALVPSWQVSGAKDALAFFGLKVAFKECLSVTDKLFNDSPLSLCPVTPL